MARERAAGGGTVDRRRVRGTGNAVPPGAVYDGGQDATGLAFAVVVSRYNEPITRRLLEGAQAVLARCGAARVDVTWVPGALEIPLAAQRLARTGRYDAVICLGCVIKGETLHFDLVAWQAAAGMARVALETGVPVINEVLAVYDPAHAAARAGGTVNRGEEAAAAAVAMARLLRALPPARAGRAKEALQGASRVRGKRPAPGAERDHP